MASLISKYTRKARAAMAGARDGWFSTDVPDVMTPDGFGTFTARDTRYRFLEAVANQEAFRNEVNWPVKFRASVDLYKFIRDQMGIGFQLVEFWGTHIAGGSLDPVAGDGRDVPSALPILMDVERANVRLALGELWKRSNFNIKKDVITRMGCMLGDVFIAVEDDPRNMSIRLKGIHPGRVRWVEPDDEGNVKAYRLQYRQRDPRNDATRADVVEYAEECRKVSATAIEFKTFLDNNLFQWPGNPSSVWEVDEQFVPMVKVEHKDTGVGWGQAEVTPSLADWRELSDLGSLMTDWCRRALNSPHLVSGMKAPTPEEFRTMTRDGSGYIYTSNENARTHSLLVPLPVGEVANHMWRLRDKMLSDYPELSLQILQQHGAASGEAIRRAREPAQAKVFARRQTYYAGFERAFRMALTMGGVRRYPSYKGINENSFKDKELDFHIGPTLMFGTDPSDVIAQQLARFTAMKMAKDAGMPMPAILREFGYDPQDAAQVMVEIGSDQSAQLDRLKVQQQIQLADTTNLQLNQ